MSQFIEMFDFNELNLNSPSKDFESMCFDDTSSATKIPAGDYLQEGKYAVFDQAQDKDIAGYSNTEQGLCRDYPAVLFGDHSRVVKYINEPFFIGADGVKIIRPKEDNLVPEFLYYDLKYHNIPNTGYNRHFKYIKMISLTKASLEEQSRFLSIAHQADKSGFDGCKSQFIEMFGINEPTKPLTDFIEVSFPGEWGQEDKDGSGVKVIRTTNFTNNGKLDLSDVVTRDIDSVKVEKKKLSKGDIILERSGGTNENPVGRVVYFEEDGVYLFNNFTQLLRCKEGVNSLFIFYSLFNYYQMNKNVIRSMGNKTTGIQNLKMDRYWQIPIADVSIERQKEFESIYRQADKSGSGTMFRLAS